MFQTQLRYVQIILTLSILGGLLIMNTPLLIASLVGLILVWQLEMLTGQLRIDTNEYLLISIFILLTFLPVIFSGVETEGSIIISILSSANGYTNTEANEVCRFAFESKGDIRTNQCTPFSPFS